MTRNHNRQPWLRIGGRALTCTLVIAACLCLVPAGLCAADSPDRPKRILIIPSYNFNYLGSEWFLQGVMAEFTEHKTFPVTFFHENLQLATHPSDDKYMDNVAASLKIKYSREKPDLIIVQYRQALQFMERYGKDIFGDVPVVFAGLSVEGYNPDRLPHRYTGIMASFSATKNIELILHNHPDVRKIYVLGGSSPVEQSMVSEAIKEGKPYRGKVEFIALTDMTFPALLKKLGTVEDNSVIMYQALQLDAAGKVFVPAQAAIEIARAARVPVYGMLDTYLGSGIIGGFLINHEGLGRRAAEIAMQWLQSGVMPDTLVISEPIGSYRFDARQLQRWGIRGDTLPVGSRIEYQVFSIWDSYKKEILGGFCLILLQAALIIGLLRSRHKRIKTEGALRDSEDRFRRAAKYAPFPLMIHAEDGEVIAISQGWTALSGYAHSDIPTIDKWTERAYGFRKQKIKEEIDALYGLNALKDEGEYIIASKDGTKRVWDFSSAPLGRLLDGRRAVISMAKDVTERKRAEEKIQASLLEKETMLREIHHRVKNNLQIISSLLNMQCSHLSDEKAREALQECMVRVRTMANMHAQLYQSEDLTRINFCLFIQDLIGNISQSYGRSLSPVTIDLDCQEINLDIENSIPCGLILNELVANALKHAFPEGKPELKKGKINITMRSEDNRVLLTVQDNGIGFPETIDLTNLTSLGMELVNILVRQMNGQIDMQVDGGTTWTITFPVKKERNWRNG